MKRNLYIAIPPSVLASLKKSAKRDGMTLQHRVATLLVMAEDERVVLKSETIRAK